MDSVTAYDEESIVQVFTLFKERLDVEQDDRARIIKGARDVTAASKKVIFALQRLPISDISEVVTTVPKEIQNDIEINVSKIGKALAELTDVLGDGWKYHRQLTGAVQEHTEALLFQGFLLEKRLLTRQEIQDRIGRSVLVTLTDYMLGMVSRLSEDI